MSGNLIYWRQSFYPTKQLKIKFEVRHLRRVCTTNKNLPHLTSTLIFNAWSFFPLFTRQIYGGWMNHDS